ncbi:PLP-dependent transferase [Candidatus Woesearchaeota archaeon]|nr:PLP-dependent transferase [Candidatus Woesearchaeota archaeon]
MHEHWFNRVWKRARDSILVTPQNYDPDFSEFNQRLADAWEKVKDVSEPSQINIPMSRIGQLAAIRAWQDPGHFYARSGSPSHDALHYMLLRAEAGYISDVEQHVAAASFPAGMSAIDTVIEELVRHIPKANRKNILFLQGKQVYPQTYKVLGEGLEEKGLLPSVKIDTTNLGEVQDVLQRHNRKVVGIFYEPVTNPTIQYTDTRALAALAHSFDVPVIVDATFLTPYEQQPLRMGADIVIHSATKYLNGAGDMLAGVVVAPLSFVHGNGSVTGMKEVQERAGRVLDPKLAFTLAERVQHLGLRMEDHVTNACHAADYLDNSEFVERVYYPDLGNGTRSGTAGGVLSFVLKGVDGSEKIAREKALIQYLITHKDSAPISFSVGLGDTQYRMIGLNTLGYLTSHEPGLVRFAIGRTFEVGRVITFLDTALNHVYKTH